jgi:uracil-DNA glycosylase
MLLKPSGCSGCVLEHSGQGFMATSGTGVNGVLLVGEALGEEEAVQGVPFVGSAGRTLNEMLTRGGMNRDDFKVANTVWCRPPDNKLSGMWYADEAISHCSPYLDAVIDSFKPRCIVALGAVAAKRLIPNLQVGILNARGYVFWSERYKTWVIPTVHPSFIMRGKTAWAQVLIHDVQRAIEISRDGFVPASLDYTLDPTPADALKWVEEFETYASAHEGIWLSTDIETPDKIDDEEDLDLEDGSDFIILRCGYSYRAGHALSIPWDGPYRQVHARLLSSPYAKLFWNAPFDVPRILSQRLKIDGAIHDGMDAWHVLNSDLKKALGFVAPFFAKNYPMWKHTSSTEPAKYNAMDADVAGINMRGTVDLLKKHGMWKVYDEFVVQLDPVFSAMTRAGLPIDESRRIESSKQLIERRKTVRAQIEEIVPESIKIFTPAKGYVRPPADTTGLREVLFDGIRKLYCPHCRLASPPKSHFKAYKKKVNECAGLQAAEKIEGETRWVKVLPFVPSTDGILRYQRAKGYPFIFTGRKADRKVTADEKAIKKLIGKYPKDLFFPLVLEDREYTKLGGTYIGWFNPETGQIEGGFPVGRDGRVHSHIRNTPSTLRTSMVNPNLQNLPRGNDSEVQRWVKQMFVAPEGWTFVARDFSGIEAQLVGVHAGDREFLRLAKIDIHSYFTAHNLNRLGKLPNEDLPSLSWSDKDLGDYLRTIKKRFKAERDVGKRCIHAGNYRVGAYKLQEEHPEWFPKVKEAAMALGLFYEVFPSINRWHERICLQANKDVIARNSFGHAHRFYQVIKWEKVGRKWEWSYADDAKRLIAFGPQSDAALIGRRAVKNCYYNYPSNMAQWLRLFIHDELFVECPADRAFEADSILQYEMERPIPEIPLDPSWGFGTHLKIESEGKRGNCWAEMN